MSFTELYRPENFEEICGQENSIRILHNFLNKKERPHTYLISGEYGIGKTSLARIFLKELGCDCNSIIEINSSNNRGIDTARNIIESCMFYPMFGNIQAYILDECQKFTIDFQNAMLKILEDTPEYVYFILCTTDSGKLLKPIKSRCTELKLELLSIRSIVKYLKFICQKEDKNISVKILKQIAETSEGHLRDAIKILEKIINIDDEEVQLRIASQKLDEEKEIIDLCRALLKKNNWDEVRMIIKEIKEDSEKIRRTVLGYMNSVLLNMNDINKGKHAALVIEFFIDPFYNSGKAGLTAACFNIFLNS